MVTRHGDWELICTSVNPDTPSASGHPSSETKEASVQLQEGTGASICRLAQHHAIANTQTALLVINVLLDGNDTKPVAILSVPPGVYLAPGILIRIDQQKPFKLLYETCNAQGCHAGFELKPAVLQSLRRGLVAVVRFFDPQQKPIDVKVSLVGFTKGFADLSRRDH